MNPIKLPFNSVTLNLSTGGHLVLPLHDLGAFRLNRNNKSLATEFADVFQKEMINKGNYESVLRYFKTMSYTTHHTQVSFKPPKDAMMKEEVNVGIDYIAATEGINTWLLIPALGIETFAAEGDDVNEAVVEAVRSEFTRSRRMIDFRLVLQTLWYSGLSITQDMVELKFYTPSELEKIEELSREALLPKVTYLPNINQQVLYGFEKELKQLARILQGKFNRSVLIVGRTGVGKTTLVHEVTRPKHKFNIAGQVRETTASAMIKELTQDTGWQDNLSRLCKELSRENDLLFVRNLMELFEVGQYEGNSVSMATYLREYIGRGEISLISECSEEEFAIIETRAQGFTALFQVIRMAEPQGELLEQIITHKINDLASDRKIEIEPEAVREAIRLHQRYLPYSGFAGKPIRFLQNIIVNHKNTEKHLTRSNVVEAFCEETGMPIFMVDPAVPMDVQGVRQLFSSNVFGQDKATDAVVNVLASVKTALLRQGKPIASLLFVGPTGVGKTEMGKVLAEFMFGSRDALTRFDMSEYSNPYTVMRLTNNGSGDGALTAAVRRQPFGVLLFDELEKADDSFYDLLLQILGEGRLTDSQGRLVNFCSTLIIMTSNIGARSLQNARPGFGSSQSNGMITAHFEDAVRKHFRPELFNRLDNIIAFDPLDQDTIQHVLQRELKLLRLREGLRYRNLSLTFDEPVYAYLGRKGYDRRYGAREMQRTIREELVIPLSRELNAFRFDDHVEVNISTDGERIFVEAKSDPLEFDLLLETMNRQYDSEKASDLRRRISRLMSGQAYTRIMSNLDMMEHSRKKNNDAFWGNKRLSQHYQAYHDAIAEATELAHRIGEHEKIATQGIMGLSEFPSELKDELTTWNNDFYDYKIRLMTTLNPSSDTCYMTIWGATPEVLFDYYKVIFEQKKFDYKVETLWYNATFYNRTRKDGEPLYVAQASHTEHSNEPNFNPPQEGDLLVGLTMTIKGTAPHVYLVEEEGIHRFYTDEKTFSLFYLSISPKECTHLPGIFRLQMISKMGQPRRTYTASTFEDGTYKIPRVNLPRLLNPASIIIKKLDELFERKMEAILK